MTLMIGEGFVNDSVHTVRAQRFHRVFVGLGNHVGFTLGWGSRTIKSWRLSLSPAGSSSRSVRKVLLSCAGAFHSAKP